MLPVNPAQLNWSWSYVNSARYSPVGLFNIDGSLLNAMPNILALFTNPYMTQLSSAAMKYRDDNWLDQRHNADLSHKSLVMMMSETITGEGTKQ